MTQPCPLPSHWPPAFRAYVRPATARPQLWRLGLGILLSVLVYVAGIAAVIGVVWALGFGGLPRILNWLTTADTPEGTLLLLATFAGAALGPMLAVRLLHRRSVGSLFGRASVVLRDFTIAAGIVAVIFGLTLIPWAWHYDAVPALDLSLWLRLLPLALLGLLVQTGAEELLFRGYLTQQLAARFRSPLVWMLLPSLLFGALHYDPETAGGNVWLIVAATAAFGLVAADLTRITGSLGAAWGFHFANNVAAILILATDGSLTGLALFTTPYAGDDAQTLPGLVLIDLAVMALAWAVCRRVLRR